MKRKSIGYIDLSDLDNPRIKMESRRTFMNDLKDFKNNQKVIFTVETYRKDASIEQRGVLHWYCSELAEYLGMEMLDFKLMMKQKFLKRPKINKHGEEQFDPETGEILMEIPSSEDLDTLESFDFCEKIRMWGLDFLKYELPLPDKNYKLFKKINTEKSLKPQ